MYPNDYPELLQTAIVFTLTHKWLGLAAISLLLGPILCACESALKRFAIPESDAIESLQLFVRQSGKPLIYLVDRVRGVQTNGVKGKLDSLAALKQLLRGTDLEPLVDESSGVIFVNRIEEEDDRQAADQPPDKPAEGVSETQQTKTEMLRLRDELRSAVRMIAASSALAAGGNALAQDEDDDDIFELSPFTVDASDQQGYRANSTLAGTRIKTDLKDLGAAISVVTEEFLEDTGATGIEDLLLYTAATEIGGPGGNFSGLDFGTDGAGSFISDDAARVNPAEGARIRGIAKPNFTRNYFSSNVRVDSYNTSGITISRGANSLLFGLGSAAGVVENSVKMPVVGENKTKLSFRFGDHGSTRGSFDLSRTIIENRLAIKISGLDNKTKYQQDPAHNNEQRGYLAFNATLLRNENIGWLGKTSLRGNMETGEADGTPPKSVTPSIGWDSFFSPPVDYYQYNGLHYFNTFPAGSNPTQAMIDSWSKWKLIDGREQADGTPGYREAENLAGDFPVYSTPFFFNPPVTTIQADGSLTLGVPGNPGLAGFRTWANGNQNTASGIPHRPGIHVNSRAYENGQQGGGFRTGTLNDPSIFDYRNHLITGDIDRVTSAFDTQTLFFEQSLFNGKGGFEIALDHQDDERSSFLPFGGNSRNSTIYVDTTMYLPDGTLNPNAGKAFISTSGTQESERFDVRERNNQRAIAYYELDFEDFGDRAGQILGKHNFTALYQEEDYEWRNWQTRGYISGENTGAALRGNNPIAGGNRKFNGAFYLTEDSLVGKDESEIRLAQLSRSHMRQDGDTWDVLFYPYTGGANGTTFASANDPSTTIDTATLEYKRWIGAAGVGREKVESKAFAWQSYLFGGHVVGLLGIREDDVTEYQRVRVDTATGETILNNNGAPHTGGALRVGNEIDPNTIDARLEQTDPTGKTTTWSVVGHLPERYLENLPVSSLSAHYAVSENFQPGESGVDHDGNFVPAPSGETTEIGINIGLAENKWNVRFNRFETAQLNRTASSLNSAKNNSTNQPRGWLNDWYDLKLANEAGNETINFAREVPDGNGGMMPNPSTIIVEAIDLGFTSYDDIVNTLRDDIIPQRVADLLQWELNEDGDEWVINGPGVGDLKSVQSLDAEGYELELVGNPTPNWRISANVAKIEAIPYDSGLPFADFVGELRQNAIDAGVMELNQSNTSIVDIGVRIERMINDITNIQAQDNTPVPELREWRANVVTNYSFSEGKFKGLGMGGAMRYQSSAGVGAELMFNPDGIAVANPNARFTDDSTTTFDGWLSYKRKLMDGKINWKVQLNVRNLLGDEDDLVVYTNPAGVDKIFRVAPAVRSWFVTNTFSF